MSEKENSMNPKLKWGIIISVIVLILIIGAYFSYEAFKGGSKTCQPGTCGPSCIVCSAGQSCLNGGCVNSSPNPAPAPPTPVGPTGSVGPNSFSWIQMDMTGGPINTYSMPIGTGSVWLPNLSAQSDTSGLFTMTPASNLPASGVKPTDSGTHGPILNISQNCMCRISWSIFEYSLGSLGIEFALGIRQAGTTGAFNKVPDSEINLVEPNRAFTISGSSPDFFHQLNTGSYEIGIIITPSTGPMMRTIENVIISIEKIG